MNQLEILIGSTIIASASYLTVEQAQLAETLIHSYQIEQCDEATRVLDAFHQLKPTDKYGELCLPK